MTDRLCSCGNRLAVENIPQAMRPDRKRYAAHCQPCYEAKGYALREVSDGVSYFLPVGTVIDTMPDEDIFDSLNGVRISSKRWSQ